MNSDDRKRATNGKAGTEPIQQQMTSNIYPGQSQQTTSQGTARDGHQSGNLSNTNSLLRNIRQSIPNQNRLSTFSNVDKMDNEVNEALTIN
jgi:hypothetical protein